MKKPAKKGTWGGARKKKNKRETTIVIRVRVSKLDEIKKINQS
jgi:hypothetical protein